MFMWMNTQSKKYFKIQKFLSKPLSFSIILKLQDISIQKNQNFLLNYQISPS